MAIRDVKETKLGNFKFREIRLARGPISIGIANDATKLYVKNWAVAMLENGDILLLEEVGGQWLVNQTIISVNPNAEYISLAFSQAARPIISYEIAGGLYIYLEASDTTLGAFTGASGQLLQEPLVQKTANGSDISLIYINNNEVKYRLQGESYANEYTLYNGVEITANSKLLQIVILNLKYELIIGEYEAATNSIKKTYLLSDLYPLFETQKAYVAGSMIDGEVNNILVPITINNYVTATGSMIDGAVNNILVIINNLSEHEKLPVNGSMIDGEINNTLTVVDNNNEIEAAQVDGLMLNGTVKDIIDDVGTSQDFVMASGGMIDGEVNHV